MAHLRKEADLAVEFHEISRANPLGWELLTLGVDQTGLPVFLLSTDGAVRHANPAAAGLLARSGILQLQAGRLHLKRRAERATLREAFVAIAQAASGGSSGVDHMVVLRDRQDRSVMVLHLRSLLGPGMPPLVSLRVSDMISPAVLDPAWIARIFGLTRAEARAAAALLDGLDLREIAERQTLALETVRNHLKRAMVKVGARSQAQLVRLLASSHGIADPGVETDAALRPQPGMKR